MVRMRETDDPSRAPMAHAVAPPTKEQGRHPTDESLIQKAVREAVVKAGLTKIERNQQKIKGLTQLWEPFPRRLYGQEARTPHLMRISLITVRRSQMEIDNVW
jgi:hypothetical protein